MSQGTETAESWLDQLLHPARVPEFALHGGMTPETAWEHWVAEKNGERPAGPKTSAEAWWFDRFERAHQQEHGAEIGRAKSLADRQAEAEAG
ncbi:MAG: hypothetical protein ACRDPY_04030 [Streptosporangiaceae bacterium]